MQADNSAADVLIFVIGFFVCVIWSLRAARQRRIDRAYDFRPQNAHGGARFATNNDLRAAGLFRKKGIPIGYSPDGRHVLHYPGAGHLLTVAAARTGKGTTLLIPALLSWRSSLLCIDPKGELAAISAFHRSRYGKTFILNPFNLLPDALRGLKQARFNPLDILDPSSSSFHAVCDKLAGFVREEPHALHFSTRARTLVSGVIAALKRHGRPGEQNLPTLARVINGEIIGFCRAVVSQTTDPFIIDKLKSFADADPASKEVQDVIATARGAVGWLNNAAIADSLSGADFRFSDLKKYPGTSVYVVLPLDMLDVCSQYFREILETALADLLHEGQKGKGRPVLAIIDEMAQLGPNLRSLENAMGMAAGAAGLQLWCVLQDLSQLRGMFPQTFETVVQNCGVTTWMGLRDQTSREYVSRLSGMTEVLSRSRSVSFDPRTGEPLVSDSMSQHGRPLLLPHEVGQIAPDEMIAFVEGVRCGPIKAKRKPYWKVFPRGAYRDNPYVGKKTGLLSWLFE